MGAASEFLDGAAAAEADVACIDSRAAVRGAQKGKKIIRTEINLHRRAHSEASQIFGVGVLVGWVVVELFPFFFFFFLVVLI